MLFVKSAKKLSDKAIFPKMSNFSLNIRLSLTFLNKMCILTSFRAY